MIPAAVSFFLDIDEIAGFFNRTVDAIFRIMGRTFFFRSISTLCLSEVARIMFSQCGHGSPEEFVEDFRSTDGDIPHHNWKGWTG